MYIFIDMRVAMSEDATKQRRNVMHVCLSTFSKRIGQVLYAASIRETFIDVICVDSEATSKDSWSEPHTDRIWSTMSLALMQPPALELWRVALQLATLVSLGRSISERPLFQNPPLIFSATRWLTVVVAVAGEFLLLDASSDGSTAASFVVFLLLNLCGSRPFTR